MFDKPFDQLFRALQRIENQLTTASHQEKEILREEVIALRSVFDRFVEKWLTFEEKVADLSEMFDLELDPDPAGLLQKDSESAWLAAPPAQSQPISVLPKADEEQIVRSFKRGLGYFDLLMFPDAIRELERVVQLDGDFMVARLYLAFGYVGKADYQQAAQQLSMVAAGADDPFILATVHNTFGHIYAGKKDYRDAAEEFKQTAEYMNDFRDVYYNLGICQYNLKQYQDALASFLIAVDQEPDDWQAEHIVASIWLKLGSLEKAHEHIQKAYELNSSQFDILLLYADVSQQRGEFEIAASLYKKAARYYPKAAEPIGGLGWLALLERDPRRAQLYFKKQISLLPDDHQAQFNFAWALLQEGNAEKAKQVFRKLAVSFPEWLNVKIGIACVELEQENYRKALEHLADVLEQDNRSKEVWFYKGLAHSGLGQKDLAAECWDRCRELITLSAGGSQKA